MADDYENMYDLESMDDGEISELIRQQLSEYPEVDPDLVDVQVQGGMVTLSGRVGTEMEYQVVEQIVSDVLGIQRYSNDLVVDELVRGELSEAADEAIAEDREVEDAMGAGGERTEPSAEHLLENLETQLYGTHDMQDAIEQGESYNPPDRPIQDGTRSRENH